MLSELQCIIASLFRASCGGPLGAAGLPACGRRFALAVLFCALAPLAAVDYTWVGGTGTNWSTDANWNPSTGHPSAADDTATFNDGANDCTVDAPVSITTISIQAGYSGTISQGGSTITVGAGGFSQAGGTFTGGGAGITVTGDLTISGGMFTSTSGILALRGNLTRSGMGVFTHNSGIVALTGANQVINGSNAFNHLSKTAATACTLTFAAGSTQAVAGTLTLQGASGQAVSLRSTSPGTRWNLDAQGTRTLAFLDVMDSNSSNATVINCVGNGSTDSGNNVKWMFVTPTAFTWTGATDSNFNTGTNWYGGAVPTSTSDVVYSAVYPTNCTVNANANVKGVTIEAGYSGTITQGAFTITVGSTGWTQSGGTFAGSASAFALGTSGADGNFTLSGGTFTCTSGTTTQYGNFTHSGGTFNHNNGTYLFQDPGGGTRTINVPTSETFNHLTMAAVGSASFGSYDLGTGDTLVVLGVYSNNGVCVGYTTTGGTIESRGNVVVGGWTSSRVGTATNAFLVGGDQTISSSGGRYMNVAVGKSSGTLSVAGDLTIGQFTLTSGTFLSTPGTLRVNGNFTHTAGGTFSHNSGTVEFMSANSPTFDVAGSETLYNLSMLAPGNGDWGVAYIGAGDTLVVNGVFRNNGCCHRQGTIEVRGNVSIGGYDQSGTRGDATSALKFTGGNAQTCAYLGGSKLSGTYTIDKSGGAVTLATDFPLSASGQDLAITQGALSLAGYNLTVNDQFTLGAAGTLRLQGGETISKAPTANVGTVEYTGDGAGTAVTLKNWTYSTLSIASTTGTPSIFSLPAALTLSGNLSRSGGTLDATASNYDINLSGNWLATGGSFTARAATVTLSANASHTITGSTTFNNLSQVSTAADTLTFEAGSTQTVGGTLTLQGASGNRLRLRSTTPGSPWKLAASGSRACTYLDVQDSTSLVAPLILPSNSLDSLRNVGWFSPLIGLCWGPGTSGTADCTTDPVVWVLGDLPLGTTRTSGQGADAATTFAVRNVSDQAVQLTATAGSSGWTIATLPGPDRCWLGLGDGSGAGPFTSLDSATSPGGVVLGGNLPVSGVRAFDLQLKTPIATTTAGTTTTLTVTLTASPP